MSSLEASGVVFLHGRMDQPTDGIWNNSKSLGGELAARGIAVRYVRVTWEEEGWRRGIADLREQVGTWGQPWVVVPFTPLMWSHRGFPGHLWKLLRVLRADGAKIAIHLHDVLPWTGPTVLHRLRERAQVRAMIRLGRRVDARFVSVDPSGIPWFPQARWPDVTHLVSGSVVPENLDRPIKHEPGALRLVVFGLPDHAESEEAGTLAELFAVLAERVARVEVHLVGRGSAAGGDALRRALEGSGVQLNGHGLLPLPEVARVLDRGEAMVFLRTGVSSRRSSVAAGLAHALPIAGYRSAETRPPITEAGLALVERGDLAGLVEMLERMAGDGAWLEELSARSRLCFVESFSWPAIADRFVATLNEDL